MTKVQKRNHRASKRDIEIMAMYLWGREIARLVCEAIEKKEQRTSYSLWASVALSYVLMNGASLLRNGRMAYSTIDEFEKSLGIITKRRNRGR